MKRFLVLILICFLSLSLGACTSAAKKREKAVAVGVYKVNKAIKAGRIDEAQRFSNELTRIVAPPKQKIEVKPLEVKKEGQPAKKLVVLPEELKDKEVIVVDSEQFNKIVSESKELQKQLAEEKHEFEKYKGQVEDSIRATEKELEKERKKGLWDHIKSFFGFSIFGTILTLAGFVALCIFFPPAIPIIVNLFTFIIRIINRMLEYVASLFRKRDE